MRSRKHPPGRSVELSRREQEVMGIVWSLGECSSAEVIRRFNEIYARDAPLADTTIRTIVASLRRKGFLEPVPTIERGFRLRAVVSKDSFASRAFRSLIANLFEGSPQRAIAFLIKDQEVDQHELDGIRKLLDRGRTERRRPR